MVFVALPRRFFLGELWVRMGDFLEEFYGAVADGGLEGRKIELGATPGELAFRIVPCGVDDGVATGGFGGLAA